MNINENILLLRAFQQLLPSEEACVSFLLELFRQEGQLRCHHCQSPQVEHFRARTVRCIECSKKSWFTAGTFFERIKLLWPFLALIWFYLHNRHLSACRAHDLLQIATSSAWVMTKKIQLALLPELQTEHGQLVVLPSEAFGAAIMKRSRETPAREHPRAEIKPATLPEPGLNQPASQNNDDTEQSLSTANSVVSAVSNLQKSQLRILDVLVNADTSVHFDQLSDLTGLSANDLFLDLAYLELQHLVSSKPGNRYTVERAQLSFLRATTDSITTEELKKHVAAFLTFSQETFRGISRKYLQLYLSQFARTTNESPNSWNELIATLLNCRAVSYKEIIRYVSPPAVSMSLTS